MSLFRGEDMTSAFLKAIYEVAGNDEPLSTDHPHVTRPAELPEFRDWLVEQWRPGNIYAGMATKLHLSSRGVLPDDFSPLETEFDPYVLQTGRLYYVTTEMCELISAAARTLPPATLTDELMPCPSGVVFFETPLVGIAADTNDTIPVRVVLWGDSRVPSLNRSIGIGAYGDFDNVLAPCGRTDWVFGDDTDEPPDKSFLELPEAARRIESMAQDRRWAATLWLLLSQGGIAATRTEVPQRAQFRRAQRHNPSITRDQLTVRVVNVHSSRASSSHGDEGHDVNWSHRWIVGGETGGFWRQQAYGPNHSLRRPKFILPFVKGPADKPLIIKDTVHVLKEER